MSGWLLMNFGLGMTNRCLALSCPDPLLNQSKLSLLGMVFVRAHKCSGHPTAASWPHCQAQTVEDSGVGQVWSQHHTVLGLRCWCVFTQWLSSWILLSEG